MDCKVNGKVKLFISNDCPYCKKALDMLSRSKLCVDYEIKNLDDDGRAVVEADALAVMSIPTAVLPDGKKMHAFEFIEKFSVNNK